MTTLEEALTAIRGRERAATLGPWNMNGRGSASAFNVYGADNLPVATSLRNPTHGGPENAEFIAHARTDVPLLLAAVDAVLNAHECPSSWTTLVNGARVLDPVDHECPVDIITAALAGGAK